MAENARVLLLWGVYPLLVLAGLLDWWCHRRTAIERTAGLRENLFHWVLYLQIGLGVLAVVLLETTGAVLLLAAALWLVHEVTVWIELRQVVALREVSPFEQLVHSFQELLPLAALGLLVVLAGERVSEWSLAWREPPWPMKAMVAGAAATALFNALPLAEETRRCLRARIPVRLAPR